MSANTATTTSFVRLSTGAISVKNEKGQLSMQPVKVTRYVTGRKPNYANQSDDDSDEEEFPVRQPLYINGNPVGSNQNEDAGRTLEESPLDLNEHVKFDPRLKRMQGRENGFASRICSAVNDIVIETERKHFKDKSFAKRHESESESDSAEELMDEEERAKRRVLIRKRVLKEEEELLEKEEDNDNNLDPDSSNESAYEESSEESEEEKETCPRMKPIFVRKNERGFAKEKDSEYIAVQLAEEQARVKQQNRRKDTLKLLEDEMQKEKHDGVSRGGYEYDPSWPSSSSSAAFVDVNTDEENDVVEYEEWKIRELKRLKRDREERETALKEKLEIKRIRSLTERERLEELKLKPKIIVNKKPKGNYKFLQKYYHRGAFFLNKEEDVFKQDFSEPTLEDHFNKSVLPKVMQVKRFGMSGRTKYTHLVDQDTTNLDSAWAFESAQNLKFAVSRAGGVRQHFEKPGYKRTTSTNQNSKC